MTYGSNSCDNSRPRLPPDRLGRFEYRKLCRTRVVVPATGVLDDLLRLRFEVTTRQRLPSCSWFKVDFEVHPLVHL
jgi:hypothetical protein